MRRRVLRWRRARMRNGWMMSGIAWRSRRRAWPACRSAGGWHSILPCGVRTASPRCLSSHHPVSAGRIVCLAAHRGVADVRRLGTAAVDAIRRGRRDGRPAATGGDLKIVFRSFSREWRRCRFDPTPNCVRSPCRSRRLSAAATCCCVRARRAPARASRTAGARHAARRSRSSVAAADTGDCGIFAAVTARPNAADASRESCVTYS